ncbi:MAG TPA: hypothetical protein VJR89_07020 [Polyangiales bacterium]|nr:hypothetical protein [Polyangiales bacterium]
MVVEPAERQLPGAEVLVKIYEQFSKQFDYRPSTILRVRVVRPKPIPRSMANPALTRACHHANYMPTTLTNREHAFALYLQYTQPAYVLTTPNLR